MDQDVRADHIAVIGLACRVPGADTPEQFWDLLREGRCTVTRPPDGVRAQPDQHVAAGGLLARYDHFDAGFFGFSDTDAYITDPQQRVLLECAWEALEDAGHLPERFPGRIGLYAGAGHSDYLHRLTADRELLEAVGEEALILATSRDFLCTRVAHRLDLRGPAITVQTACSTSLVAVHQAVRALQGYECDLALAGGVAISLEDTAGYTYRPGGILSPDGVCRAFSDDAEGTVPGDGAGLVVLRRLADALAEGDHVHAVIRGSAVNNDGAARVGFTAPSPQGQAEVIAEAIAVAELKPDDIGYVEAHGTGTALGDPIELAALQEVFGRDRRGGRLAVGSVKPNVGHLDTAAGVVGLIKAVLAVERAVIPPSLHVARPTRRAGLDGGPITVSTGPSPWPDGLRRAGVSSFGVGGTNAHVVIEQLDPALRGNGTTDERPGTPAGPETVVLSARDEESLDRLVGRFRDWARGQSAPLADVAGTLQLGRQAFGRRAFAVLADTPGIASASWTRAVAAERSAVFLFPGQGAQYPGMACGLYAAEASFRADIDECARVLKPALGLDPRDVLRDGTADRLDETWLTQPVLFSVEYALARLWMRWGVRPAAMLGHSLGEYAAATVAGVFRLPDALHLVAERGRLVQSLPAGAMLAVHASPPDVVARLGGAGHGLDVAAVNAADATVVAGEPQAVAMAESVLTAAGVRTRRLRGAHAFHSRLTEPVLAEFERAAETVPMSAPEIPFVSNVTGTWIRPAEATDPAYWARHLRSTVRFADGVRALGDLGTRRAGIEMGPGHTLTRLAAAADAELEVCHSLPDASPTGRDDLHAIRTALGQAWSVGLPVDWSAVRSGRPVRKVSLPTYPFRPDRHGPGRKPPGSHHAGLEPALTPAREAAGPGPAREVIADLWCRLLGIPAVKSADDFFDLGGDSLIGIQLLARIRQEFGVHLTPAVLFEHSEFGRFVDLVVTAERPQEAEADPQIPGLLEELGRLSPAQARALLSHGAANAGLAGGEGKGNADAGP